MKAMIRAISSISHQDSFESPNVYAGLKKLEADHDVVAPDYKAYIDATALRRLSPVLRMGLTASKACQAKVEGEFDAISVGTALGCLKDTEKFLVTYLTTTSDFLSPTAFIQSTHNTIGGQISLGLGNHAYNMTHTQNNLSFEIALLDGLLCVEEGCSNVLVGAADERIDFLEHFRGNLIKGDAPLSSGATFLVLDKAESDLKVGVRAVKALFHYTNLHAEIAAFLAEEGLKMADIDLICANETLEASKAGEYINYLDYTGLHYSASSFAVHIAHDYLILKGRFALVVNSLCQGKLGLTLLERV